MDIVPVVLMAAAFLLLSNVKAECADTVFRNANIYTANDRQPRAQAIAVTDSRIVYVGSSDGVAAYEDGNTRRIDLHGNTVVPGLTDSHCHLQTIGEREMTLNLEGVSSLDDLLTEVKAQADRADPGDWIAGRGWIETFWKPPVFPTRRDLDRASPRNPVFLVRTDGHGAVANSAALKIAGIDENTPDPFGGEISKDKKTAQPDGMLLDTAQRLVREHMPETTKAEHERAMLLGAERSVAFGWCQVQDAGGDYADVDLLEKLYAEDKIKLRVYKAVHGPSKSSQRLLREGPTVGAFDARFTLRSIKILFDGALGSRGAALLVPYSDDDTAGFLIHREEELLPVFEGALRRGIQVQTHAIGDRANRTILDLYERAFEAVPPDKRRIPEPRWRIEHAQIVHPSDIPRFGELGVIPSMQPSHAISDLHFAPDRLGIDRLEGAYAWRSFIESGSIIAGGSDAPVERGDPMVEFYAAITRKDRNGFSGEGWHPEEILTRGQALRMFTLWPAYAAFEEDLRGSLEPGKLADLTVLSDDIMEIPESNILKTECTMTVIGGEIVFSKHTD